MSALVRLIVGLAVISIMAGVAVWTVSTFWPMRTITVVGKAVQVEKNQVAQYYVSADAINDDRDTAVKEVNQKLDQVIKVVKEFGIPETDLQTQNMGLYRQQTTYYEDGVQKNRPGQWSANNSLSIKLRNVERATDLSQALIKTGLTNISGPNFTLDTDTEASTELLSQAVADARDKAAQIAGSQNLTLGSIVSIREGGSTDSNPVYGFARMEGGGGGGGAMPGSAEVWGQVTVTFQLEKN